MHPGSGSKSTRKRRPKEGRIILVRVPLQIWKHPGYQDKPVVSMMEQKRFQTR
jgi:hypothetical protein